MSKLSNAVDQLHAWAEQQRAIVDLADALKGVASVDLATDEAQARLDAARSAEEEAKTALAAMQGQVVEATANRDRIIAEAKVQASAILEAGAAKGKGVIDNAAANAASIMKQANTQAEAIRMQASNDAVVAHELAAKARAELAGGKQAIMQAQEELADLRAKIDAAKAQIAKMLG